MCAPTARYKEKVDYIVDEFARCQQARKTGYVGAIPKEDSIFWKVQHGIIKTAGFDLNGGWSPWYTVHKVMAGLTDAYMNCDNAKALTIVTGMADWPGTILKDLSEDQLEEMRKCEYGGMNDVLVHVHELTANKKYLDLSYKFHDQFVLGQLAQHVDALKGKHSIGDDQNRGFDFLVDGVKVGTQELKGGTTGRFFDGVYLIPDELLKGKSKIEVRVQAHPNKTAGRVFSCRIIRN